jgi:riboflavin synthase
MFTGIIEELGSVSSRGDGRLEVACRTVASDAEVGSSISVSGTCLTVVARADDSLAFDLSKETLDRTTLGGLVERSPVNLERPVTLATRLGGHLVQGHVDGVGVIDSIEPDINGGAVVNVTVPSDLMPFIVEKGSIAIDGVSLTVAGISGSTIGIALIPQTMAATTFGVARPSDRVNVEVDVMAKYARRLTEGVER